MRVAIGVLGVVALAACRGQNLFTGVVIQSEVTPPAVTITSPGGDASIAAGAQVTVTAQVTSSQGVSKVDFSGIFDDGSAAFTSQSATLPNPMDTTVTRSLAQPGTSTGSVRIIVQATDILGSTGADTVSVNIVP